MNRMPLLPLPNSDDQAAKALREFARHVITDNGTQLKASNAYVWRSYNTLYGMYVALFAVGLVTAIAAVIKGFMANSGGEAIPALVFAGLSAGSFFTLFLTRPLESLERNSIYSSWLIAAMNTYWTQLVYLKDPSTIEQDLKQITADLVVELTALGSAYANAYAKYPTPTAAVVVSPAAPSSANTAATVAAAVSAVGSGVASGTLQSNAKQ